MFAFAERESKVSNNEKPNSIPNTSDELEAQLLKLKSMYKKRILEKDAYDHRVELLLDKFGFKLGGARPPQIDCR
jgi:hypothetical protein